ncbi:MAG: transposase [OCS116 cluster bacterium]|uniref:Integrase catalytic domain-containing protein n=1 Tax=OCS116 cluster bacterium TaxID=2030921 RepID=A0A2A4YUK3_9PROT|nr:transposase [OCS116 cluster bacterium]
MRKGFLYLVAIMDWATCRVLSWRLSNTMETDFCIEALNEAIHRFGTPKIFNTDQDSQFTSWQWINTLKSANIKISMDGKGGYLDNIFIERLWRSLKYECVYLHAWSGSTEAREGIAKWIDFYNTQRPHKAHCGLTPDVIYWKKLNNQPNDWSVKSVV